MKKFKIKLKKENKKIGKAFYPEIGTLTIIGDSLDNIKVFCDIHSIVGEIWVAPEEQKLKEPGVNKSDSHLKPMQGIEPDEFEF